MAATLVSLSFFTRGSGNGNGGRREFEGKPFLITCSSNLGVSLKSFFISPALLNNFPLGSSIHQPKHGFQILPCLPSYSSSPNKTTNSAFNPSTKLYVSGLSFRTTEEGLRNAFLSFGQLVEVKLVMDKIANRSRGFAFLRYATEDESKKAIEGMHGKFLDGRVIFVEVAKPRSELRHGSQKDSQQYR